MGKISLLFLGNFAKRKNKSTSKIPHLKLNTSPKRTSSIDLNNLIVKKSRNDSNEGYVCMKHFYYPHLDPLLLLHIHRDFHH
jgi:hypothetical protein